MKYLDVLDNFYDLMLRKDTGASFTFSFTEDKYKFCYHSHRIGRDLRIYIVAPDGDELRVYNETECYELNGLGSGLDNGFVPGPWVMEIKKLFLQFEEEINQEIIKRDKDKKNIQELKEKEEYDRINKFRKLVTTKVV